MVGGDVLDVHVGDPHRSGPRGRQAAGQLADGRLAAAGAAHQRHPAPGEHLQAEVLDHGRRHGAVAEGHVLQAQAPPDLRHRGHRCALADLEGMLVLLVVQNVVEAADVTHDRLEAGAELRELLDRIREAARQRLEGHQPTDGQHPLQHPIPPEAQDGDGGQRREQRRHHVQQAGAHTERLLGLNRIRVLAGPPREERVLRAVRLQGFDHVQTVDRRGGHLGLLLEQAAAVVLARPRGRPQRHHVERDHPEHRKRQGRIVGEHDPAVGDHGEQVDRADRQLARDHLRHLVVRPHPGGDVPGVALVEEGHRQGEEVQEESRGGDDGELGLHARQAHVLEPGEPRLQARGEPHADHQRNHQRVAARDQHVVHEDLEKRRQGDAGNDQRQRRQYDEEKRRVRIAQPGEQATQHARRPAALEKPGTGLKEEADLGVVGVELVPGERTRPLGRVVDVDTVATESLEHYEVVEIPEHDHREAELQEAPGLGPHAPGDHAQRLRRPYDVERLGAVARYAAAHPQILERYPPAVMGEDHCQAGSAALGPLHLQHGGHRPAASAPGMQVGLQRLCAGRRRPAPFPWTLAAVARTHRSPSHSLSNGTASVIGGWLRVLISTEASVPGASVWPAALGEVQARPLAVVGSGTRAIRPA